MADPIYLPALSGVVRELITYPIKGCAGVSLRHTAVTPAGLAHDRDFMVVDPDGVFRSQRTDRTLALIRPWLSADGQRLLLRGPGLDPLRVAVDLTGPRRPVLLFGAQFTGIDQGDAVAGWLSRVLGAPSRLVRVPPEHHRVSPGLTAGTCGYADSCAVHLLSLASWRALNQRLAEAGEPPVPVRRFRPNIVVDGWQLAHTEDDVRSLRAGTTELGYAKPAIRCVVTTVDQDTGRKAGHEPLRTLAGYRRTAQGVAFGVNFAVTRPGRLSVGDPVECDPRPARPGNGPSALLTGGVPGEAWAVPEGWRQPHRRSGGGPEDERRAEPSRCPVPAPPG